MLKPKALNDVLRQAHGGGVQHVMLFKKDGALISFATESERDAKITSAIASNIWSIYESHRDAVQASEGQLLLIDCDSGRLFVTPVGGLLLCLSAQPNTGFGLLKLKAHALRTHLEEPLSQVHIK